MIELLDARPPASADNLEAAEKRPAALGQHIPMSYKALLAEHDGGLPVQNSFSFEERSRGEQHDRVSFFLGVARSPDGDPVETAEALDGRVFPGMLPIAGDPFGNSLLLDSREGSDGPVWFWDHELETDPPDGSNLSKVAPGFTAFLDGLVESPRPPRPQPRSRWKRLLRR